jgi:hypothetical protein
MTQTEYNNVFITATLKAFRAVIDAGLSLRDQPSVDNLLSDNDVFNLLIASSQCNDEVSLGREAKRINRIAFPTYDLLHAPGSSLKLCFSFMLKFGAKYKECFVPVESALAVTPEHSEAVAKELSEAEAAKEAAIRG